VLAGTLARVLARRGRPVLALDSDLMPGLALSLGADPPEEPPLQEAAERDAESRWRLRPGIGPARAVARFSTPAPDGVRLLQCGKSGPAGLEPIMPALQAYYRVVHGLRRRKRLRALTLVGDLHAGPRQAAFDWAPYADLVLVVTTPSQASIGTARRIARIVRSRGRAALPVANRVEGEEDVRLIERGLGERVAAAIPADEAVREAERAGAALLDHAPGSRAVGAIERLASALERHTLREEGER
jgi:CO dehydrogenase maturation factor